MPFQLRHFKIFNTFYFSIFKPSLPKAVGKILLIKSDQRIFATLVIIICLALFSSANIMLFTFFLSVLIPGIPHAFFGPHIIAALFSQLTGSVPFGKMPVLPSVFKILFRFFVDGIVVPVSNG